MGCSDSSVKRSLREYNSMSAISLFKLPATLNFNAEQALQSALQEDLKEVLIAGYDQQGELVIRSSRLTCAEAAFLAEKAKLWSMSGGAQQ